MEKNSPSQNFSLEAEQSVIGGLMLKNDALPDVSNVLSSDDFYDKRHQLLFKAIQNLANQKQPFDPVTLSEQLQKDGTFNVIGGGPYLGLLATNTPSAANIMAYARIVKEKSINRQTIALMNQAIASDNDPLGNLDQLITLKGELARATNGFQDFGKRTNTVINEDDEPIEWLVDGLITTSSRTLLVAKPKVGKTIMSLDIAISVACGGYTLGKYECKQGDVLYLALEGGEKRLKGTIKRLMSAYHMTTLPNSFYHETECLSIDNGGLTAIEAWCKRVNNPSLIVIDILQNFRPAVTKGQSVYDADYASTQALKTIVEKYGVAILIDHHANKRTADGDVIDLISGSNGLAGGVDNTLVMIRPLRKKTGTLHRIGRDYVCDDDITIRLEDEGYFSVINPEDALLKERKEIVDVMKQGYSSAKEIADVLDGNPTINSISKRLYRMLKDGIVNKSGYGKYELTENYDAKLSPSSPTSCNPSSNMGATPIVQSPTQSPTAKLSPSSPTSCNVNNDKGFDEIGQLDELDYLDKLDSSWTQGCPTSKSSNVNNDVGLSEQNAKLDELDSLLHPPSGKPLNGKFVPLDKYLTIKRHRDLGLDEFFQNKAMVRGTVYDHYYIMFVRAFKNEYKRNAGRVICKIVNEMGKGYPFSQAMTKILDSREILKEVRYGWTKIKTRLSDQYGEDELEAALKELIEAGFVEHDDEKQTLKFVD